MIMDGEDEDDGFTLSLDAILDVLSHHHRRTLLRWLQEQPNQCADVQDVITQLVEQERERTGKTPNSDYIQITLYHVHQPKLSETELITYDDKEEEFRYHQNDQLEKWLELIDAEHESEW